jgi:mannosyltransferase OCH1-like enzyme
MSHTTIPLIVHQTWKNTNIETWTDTMCDCVERWLGHALEGPFAYFLWDDNGIIEFLNQYEPAFIERFTALAANVERSDIFRVLVAKHVGGIYGDLDTYPLRAPATWIAPSDLAPWVDMETGASYNFTGPVSAIFGIEADCPPDTDDYWRLGYTNPVQLTQWALASAPQHPVLVRFMDTLLQRLDEVASHHGGTLKSPSAFRELKSLDPLLLTGPDAITVSTQTWLGEIAGLRWNALTGLYDGGRSKLVDDVVILPITGFSPGRSEYGNMGSKPITDPAARLLHHAQGSWRYFNLRVEVGKFCRTFLGMCKDWSKY